MAHQASGSRRVIGEQKLDAPRAAPAAVIGIARSVGSIGVDMDDAGDTAVGGGRQAQHETVRAAKTATATKAAVTSQLLPD
jgi:hypothetical protein